MFTGIIEDLGTVQKINKTQITVETKLDDIKIGDSVCINGVCLTVNRYSLFATGHSPLAFDISEETYNKTNFKRMMLNDKVNLERALKIDGRLGGHFVTGHIDGTEKILEIKESRNSEIWRFSISTNLSKNIVEKGSIAIDGISLTIVEKNENSFTVAAVPHTLKNTTLKVKKVQDSVNVEVDVLGKYVLGKNKKNKITTETLKKAGFL